MIYGTEIGRNLHVPLRSVVEDPETSAAGNTILRVGREVEGGTWQASEHVVLTPSEAYEYARSILAQIPLPRVDIGLQSGEHRTFFGATAISDAETYIGVHIAEGEWHLDVSDDRCANCLQTFSAEARVETAAGWVCPFCAGDPRAHENEANETRTAVLLLEQAGYHEVDGTKWHTHGATDGEYVRGWGESTLAVSIRRGDTDLSDRLRPLGVEIR